MRILTCTLTEINVFSKCILQKTTNGIHTKTDCKEMKKSPFKKIYWENVLAPKFIQSEYFRILKTWFSQLRIMETILVSLKGFELCLQNIKQTWVSLDSQSSNKTMCV